MNRTYRLFAVAGVMISINASCGSSPFSRATVNMPAELDYVRDNEAQFKTGEDPLGAVTPGTPMDDLAGLAGCWGVALTERDGEEAPVKIYHVFRFEAETGEFRGWTFQDTFGLFPVIGMSEGTFEVVDESRLQLMTGPSGGNDPITGDIEMMTVEPPLEQRGLATLSGDALNLLLGVDDPDDIAGDTESVVYRRFDCP